MKLIDIPANAFSDIHTELLRQRLLVNPFRNVAGVGRSQTFGVVNRRCLAPDYCRLCWARPYLYKLLLEFGATYVPFSFTSITVNDSYRAAPHRDKGNTGDSLVVAFGEYTGGDLRLHEGDDAGVYDIKHRGIVADFKATLHSVEPFEGRRFSLVFYNIQHKRLVPLPPPSIVQNEDGKYAFKRGDEVCNGLPHPLRGMKHKNHKKHKKAQAETDVKESVSFEVTFD